MLRPLKIFAFLSALNAPAAFAQEAGIHLDVQNFTAERGITTATLAITNTTDRHFSRVYASCAFLDKDDRAIDIGRALASNVAAGATVYEQARIGTTAGVQFADCRIERAVE